MSLWSLKQLRKKNKCRSIKFTIKSITALRNYCQYYQNLYKPVTTANGPLCCLSRFQMPSSTTLFCKPFGKQEGSHTNFFRQVAPKDLCYNCQREAYDRGTSSWWLDRTFTQMDWQMGIYKERLKLPGSHITSCFSLTYYAAISFHFIFNTIIVFRMFFVFDFH